MKIPMLSAIGFLASTAVAAPSWDGCNNYNYDLPKCPQCPSEPGAWGPGSHSDKCHKECPAEYRQCYQYEEESYSKKYASYELSHNEEISCPSDYSYDLDVKIEECSEKYSSNKKCLNVYYGEGSGYKRGNGGITESNLGIYLDQKEHYSGSTFNYNDYCHHNYCSVPAEDLPGSEDLCGKDIYLAVGNNRCYDYQYEHEEYQKSIEHVKAHVNCGEKQNEEKCKEYCCCPFY